MYQQYVNEVRAAQQRDARLQEAATERALRAARRPAEEAEPADQPAPAAARRPARGGLLAAARQALAPRGHSALDEP